MSSITRWAGFPLLPLYVLRSPAPLDVAFTSDDLLVSYVYSTLQRMRRICRWFNRYLLMLKEYCSVPYHYHQLVKINAGIKRSLPRKKKMSFNFPRTNCTRANNMHSNKAFVLLITVMVNPGHVTANCSDLMIMMCSSDPRVGVMMKSSACVCQLLVS